MAAIPVGTRGEEKLLVTADVAIGFLGEDARVLSTPEMIRHMERTCRLTALPLLDAGCDTVGTHVDVWHRGAAAIGDMVVFTAEVMAVEGRRIHFRVEARDESILIGEGTHERTVIDVARFAARLSGRKEKSQ
jgi:fluoroacetyl-CoA thioesterase